MQGIQVNLTGTQVSDLFFNSDLSNYNEYFKKSQLTKAKSKSPDSFQEAEESQTRLRRAVEADAADFTSMLLGSSSSNAKSLKFRQDLVADFFERL